jgi:hypothetical protein
MAGGALPAVAQARPDGAHVVGEVGVGEAGADDGALHAAADLPERQAARLRRYEGIWMVVGVMDLTRFTRVEPATSCRSPPAATYRNDPRA